MGKQVFFCQPNICLVNCDVIFRVRLVWFGPSWGTLGGFLEFLGDHFSTSAFHVHHKLTGVPEVGGRFARLGRGFPFRITRQGILEGDLIRLLLGFRPSAADRLPPLPPSANRKNLFWRLPKFQKTEERPRPGFLLISIDLHGISLIFIFQRFS